MASSSSSSPLVPAFSSQLWKYQVFLSFRGEDTRKNFVDHLYKALIQQGISTYKDDVTLPRGELIRGSLMEATRDSYIAVVIFSKNYANSSWCLDELEYIMKCSDTRGLIVLPVFHKVAPSIVRKQNQEYGQAFYKHKLKNEKKAKSWRKTLVWASNISGWETEKTAYGHEAKCIELIVDAISERLRQDASSVNMSSVDDNLIGIEARMKLLIANLDLGSGGVRMIGILGVGGGGKTTLASSVYDKISSTFDGCCFLENVHKKSSRHGLKNLQENMLSGVLKQKQVHVRSVEEGRHLIMSRLGRKKVLIVLNDVSDLGQLEALAGSENWFGEGSRIIITSRDEHLLVTHRVNVIHKISLLNDNEAMKLFCKHAFRYGRPIEDYEMLSRDVVSYAGGLPLALKVLGSFLCDKEVNEWRSALARLKEFPDYNGLEMLKISYDGLEPVEKRLFLDIARFFRGEHTHEGVMTVPDDWGFHHARGIKVLIGKGLINISLGKFVMHDLLQDMAHYIYREEQQNSQHKHSIVWKKEDDVNICATEATMVGANMKKRWWNCLNIKHRVRSTHLLLEKFQPRDSGLTLSELVQKQLWEAYRAEDPDMLLPQTNKMNYHKSLTPGDRGISLGYDPTADSYEEDGHRRLIPVCNGTEKNERIEREILRKFEKGKNKVEMEVVDQMGKLEDRIVNRMEGFFEERVNKLENRMVEMERMVVKGMEMLTNKTVEIQGGVVQRMERLTDRMAELEEGVVERFRNEMVERMTINQKMSEIE